MTHFCIIRCLIKQFFFFSCCIISQTFDFKMTWQGIKEQVDEWKLCFYSFCIRFRVSRNVFIASKQKQRITSRPSVLMTVFTQIQAVRHYIQKSYLGKNCYALHGWLRNFWTALAQTLMSNQWCICFVSYIDDLQKK